MVASDQQTVRSHSFIIFDCSMILQNVDRSAKDTSPPCRLFVDFTMANSRDDFSKATIMALASRAGYHCSRPDCGRSTVGPSDERNNAVMNIGVAAHICAAAPGRSARRYDATMTKEERSSFDNGIWLCASCSVIIDRDDVTYTAERLRELKFQHERRSRLDKKGPLRPETGDLIAIGPEVVGIGQILGSGDSSFKIRIQQFVRGEPSDLFAFSTDFASTPPHQRYVLLNELGVGRLVIAGPLVRREGADFEIELLLGPASKTLDIKKIGSTASRDLGKVLSGLEAFKSHLENLLGLSVGDNVFHPKSGTQISQYYREFHREDWLSRFIALEIIRLSFIPMEDKLQKTFLTPLRCVNAVDEVVVGSLELDEQFLTASVKLNIQGHGYWQDDIRIYVYSDTQLEQSRLRIVPAALYGVVD